MWKTIVFPLLTSVAAVPLVVHEQRDALRNLAQYFPRSAPDKSVIVPVRIGLVQRNLDKGYDHLLDVSDPSSSNYGKHWDIKAVEAEFAPSSESIVLVQDWLVDAGIGDAQPSNGWIAVDIQLGRLEKLINAEFFEYEDSYGNTRLGCDEYSLPLRLAAHIDYITPGVKHSPPIRKSKRTLEKVPKQLGPPSASKPAQEGPLNPPQGSGKLPPDLKTCGDQITPACVRALYHLPPPGSVNISSNGLGFYEYYDRYNQSDLDLFYAEFAPHVPQGTHPKEYAFDGGKKYDMDGGEATIDLAMAYGILGPVDILEYEAGFPSNYTGHLDLPKPFLDAVDGSFCTSEDRSQGFQCGGVPLTKVVSFSYGQPELLSLPAAAQHRACNEFMKLGLMGYTFIFSSGDGGVSSGQYNDGEFLCVDNGCASRNLTTVNNGTIFVPQFPANCPNVLSVGATELKGQQTVDDPESVMKLYGLNFACAPGTTFSSGGGFSNYFARPAYQNESVSYYLENFDPGYKYYISNGEDATSNKTNIGEHGGVYNRAGRGYPDVSANGVNFTIYDAGEKELTYGTSLAAPIWASIVTLLNSERAALGKSSVGFINPVLYQNPSVFNDITHGANPGCETQGFPARPGWDPSSGLGTPNYPALSKLFKGLP